MRHPHPWSVFSQKLTENQNLRLDRDWIEEVDTLPEDYVLDARHVIGGRISDATCEPRPRDWNAADDAVDIKNYAPMRQRRIPMLAQRALAGLPLFIEGGGQ